MHEVVLRPPPGPHGRVVEIYMSTQTPPRPYYEIAILQAIGEGSDATLEDVMQALSKRGGELGCDAVVRIQIDVGYGRSHATGLCAKYTDVAPAPPAPAPAPPRAAPESTPPAPSGGSSL
jgi:hypothetical protein